MRDVQPRGALGLRFAKASEMEISRATYEAGEYLTGVSATGDARRSEQSEGNHVGEVLQHAARRSRAQFSERMLRAAEHS